MGALSLNQLATQVRAKRHDQRLTVKQLAAKADIAANTVSRIEQGGRVRPGSLHAVLTALGIELSHDELQAATRGNGLSAPASTEVDDLLTRVGELERKVDLLTKGLHLTLVSVRPGLEWLDAMMEKGAPDGDAAKA